MDLVSALVTAAVFPWACLGFVLWMGRLEDDLPAAVQRAERQPDPPPVLAIAIPRKSSSEIPEQRRPEGAEAARLSPATSPGRRVG